jgi:type III pantothenate kinase
MLGRLEVKPSGAIIASVVPSTVGAVRRAVTRLVQGKVVQVGPGVRTGLPIDLDNPREVGADRVANAVAAVSRFGAPVITVDFGTATTVDLVDPSGRFVGGAIAPGVRISADALIDATSSLRDVDVVPPDRVVGRSTVEAIQSGLTFGFVGLVDGLVGRVLASHDLPPGIPVIATGGLASVLGPLSGRITAVEESLTLMGLSVIFERN